MTEPVLGPERRDLNGLGRSNALERGRGGFRPLEIVSMLD